MKERPMYSSVLDSSVLGGSNGNTSTTADVPTIEWNCVYCGKALGGFALATQLTLGYDGIDYCRACSTQAATARMCGSLLKRPILERGQHGTVDE